MLAYKIERYLRNAWSDLGLIVHEGILTLSKLSSSIIKIGTKELIKVPKPDKECKKLLKRIDVSLPEILPNIRVKVATREKIAKLM